MTEFDLLEIIGEAEDSYIMESRKRPKQRRSIPWTRVLAACLIVAVIGSAGTVMMRRGLGSAAEPTTADNAPAEAKIQEEAGSWDGALAAETPQPAYNVSLLSAAVYPDDAAAPYSAQWADNQTASQTKLALNAFAYSTAAAVLQNAKGSACYSPLSLYQTLSILASGAEGETRNQLLSLLGQQDLGTLASESGKLYRANYRNDDEAILKISNSLWLDSTGSDGTPVDYHKDWVISASQDYYADVYQAEFSGTDTALALGAWIADKTGGLLHPDPATLSLENSDVMAIVNTLWYDAPWSEEFDSSATAAADFHSEDGDTVSADFMHAVRRGQVVVTEQYTKSYLNLSPGRMVFVLPAEGVSLSELLTEEKLWEIFENGDYEAAEVTWSVPKFATDFTCELSETLKNLGVTSAFETERAQFSAISDTPLVLSTVRQGVHMALDEEGVEAAAYTEAAVAPGEAPPEELRQVEMNLDRPFLYLITAQDGSTLFVGVVRNPS